MRTDMILDYVGILLTSVGLSCAIQFESWYRIIALVVFLLGIRFQIDSIIEHRLKED